ncbi:MAG: HAMP domain-containing protein [Ardenticatenaceae bacterium]|nr:HAMP domain-containing protein [Anaerolineales bacterium]MCB8941743.1 HAMP domain-containing protein [Ardenticatenaceae bacterium]MCB8972854.1 HAMP domain-containing protein [Ardenticatenaceae bacterium]
MVKRPFAPTIRTRLTLWYLAVLGLILLLFTGFLYLQLRRDLYNQVDTALELAATQAQESIVLEDGRYTLQATANNQDLTRRLKEEYSISLLNGNGDLLAQLTNDPEIPVLPPDKAGSFTFTREPDMWRVYSLPITLPGNNEMGWLQVSQELEPVADTLGTFGKQILWGLPLALLLAGIGGYFLAGRALRPIDRITQTAQAISGQDLGKRIQHQGPADEIGRLAQTFDAMLDRLEAAFRREQQFTGDAAHELRTPLTALKGQLEVTLSRPRLAEEYKSTLEAMSQQVERLIHLSSNLLYLSRLEQDQQRFSTETIMVADFFNALLDQIRPLAQEKSIEISTNLPTDLQFCGQMDLLIRLFLNLLDNAIKYTPTGGSIALKAAKEDQNIHTTLHNSGQPISPEHLPHLFNRFYRAESDRARSFAGSQSGTGLGLAIAQEIAKIHHGEISVTSEPERGTTFTVILPETAVSHPS